MKKNNLWFILLGCAVIVPIIGLTMFIDKKTKVEMIVPNDKVREKSSKEIELETMDDLKDISGICEVSFGCDDEYGEYYEITMYDKSTVRFYAMDNLYMIIEDTELSKIVETPDYWFVFYDGGQSVYYKCLQDVSDDIQEVAPVVDTSIKGGEMNED